MKQFARLLLYILFQPVLVAGCGGSSGGGPEPPGSPELPPPPPSTDIGLDERPANSTCIAPTRPDPGLGVSLQRVFPQLEFQQPVLMLQAPGEASQWFVLEKSGRVLAFENQAGAAATSTMLDLSGQVDASSEGGLLGLAFAPDFSTSGIAYVSYTRPAAGGGALQSVLARYSSVDGGQTLDANSETVLLTLEQPFGNHNGGGLGFGPDGHLYMGLGDGGSGGDPNNHAQNTSNLFGTFIRIAVSAEGDYSIPASNPFAGNPRCDTGSGAAPCPEIFAWGLRNPWRWSFDRASGLLWAGDVGQNAREEIDLVRAGGNYGWRFREGSQCFNPSSGCPSAGLISPLVDYPRADGGSVTGGFVYRGEQLPALRGRYVFGDFVSGRIWTLEADEDGAYEKVELVSSGLSISSFGESNDGELFVVDFGGGLYRLEPAGLDPVETIPQRLSNTGCVDPADPTRPAPGLIPYRPAASRWADGASLERWLALPDGTEITVAADGDFEFPEGAVLMQQFSLQSLRIETQLLMHHPGGGWAGYTWRWNEAQTEALRVTGGAEVELGAQRWRFPSEAECMHCHSAAAGRTLGLEIPQLNHEMLYPQSGRNAQQLLTLDAIGLLSPPLGAPPEDLEALPDPFGDAPLAARARAYLHANCAGCHRPGGTTPSDMDWRFATELAETRSCLLDATTSADLGVPGAQLLRPGEASRSLVWLRMARRDAHAMPPLGSQLADEPGLALIAAWIDALSDCDG
jgi:uncharacterized repeat protein (TIGR03806 family)